MTKYERDFFLLLGIYFKSVYNFVFDHYYRVLIIDLVIYRQTRRLGHLLDILQSYATTCLVLLRCSWLHVFRILPTLNDGAIWCEDI